MHGITIHSLTFFFPDCRSNTRCYELCLSQTEISSGANICIIFAISLYCSYCGVLCLKKSYQTWSNYQIKFGLLFVYIFTTFKSIFAKTIMNNNRYPQIYCEYLISTMDCDESRRRSLTTDSPPRRCVHPSLRSSIKEKQKIRSNWAWSAFLFCWLKKNKVEFVFG